MEKGGGGSGQLNRQTNKQTNKQKIKLIWKNIPPPRIELGTACTHLAETRFRLATLPLGYEGPGSSDDRKLYLSQISLEKYK